MSRAITTTYSGPQSKSTAIDKVAGLLVPTCLFVEPANAFLLTDAGLYDADSFSVPVSFVALPFFLGYVFHNRFQKYFYNSPLLAILALFVGYCLVMGVFHSVSRDSQAILYAFQWVVPFLWLPYFLTIMGSSRFKVFSVWLFLGVAFNLGYYGLSAGLELVQYGGLGDGGRMTQNLILPGQYQIAVYVPTVVALSVSLLNGLFLAKELLVERRWIVLLNIAALMVLLALAAREGLLIYVLATLLLLAVRSANSRFLLTFAALLIGSLLVINLDAIFEALGASDLRIFNKIATLQNEDARFGGRDVMIRDAMQVFYWDPMLGSRFLPPNVSEYHRAVLAPSAHNMYIDALVWTGLVGGALFILSCLWLFGASIRMITNTDRGIPACMRFVGVVLLVFLLFSNNTNVPMRQPVTGPMVAFMIAMAIHYLAIARREA